MLNPGAIPRNTLEVNICFSSLRLKQSARMAHRLTITSSQNPRIKAAVRLRQRKGRDRQGRIVIDSLEAIRQALDAQVALVEAFVCPEYADTQVAQELLVPLREFPRLSLFEVGTSVWDKLAFGQRRDGVLCVATTPPADLADLNPPSGSLIVVLDGVEKPGNLGAVARSCDAVGVGALIVAGRGTDLFNPNAIRASLGTLFHVPLGCGDSRSVRQWLEDRGTRIVTTRVGEGDSYDQASWDGDVALVLGSEAYGLSEAWAGSDVQAIHLPMLGRADSLNVSNTAAVVLYEALRQQQKQ